MSSRTAPVFSHAGMSFCQGAGAATRRRRGVGGGSLAAGRSFDGLRVLLEVTCEAAAHHTQRAVLEVGEALQQLQREDARLVGAVPELVEGVAQQRHHLRLVHCRLLAGAVGLLLARAGLDAAVRLLARALRLVGVHLVLVVLHGLHRRVGVGGGRRRRGGAPTLAQRLLLLVVAVVLVGAQVGQVLSRLLAPCLVARATRVLQLPRARLLLLLLLLLELVVVVVVAVAGGAQPVARRDGRELLDLVVPVRERGLRLREPRVALVHAR